MYNHTSLSLDSCTYVLLGSHFINPLSIHDLMYFNKNEQCEACVQEWSELHKGCKPSSVYDSLVVNDVVKLWWSQWWCLDGWLDVWRLHNWEEESCGKTIGHQSVRAWDKSQAAHEYI